MTRDVIALAALFATSLPSTTLAQPRPRGDVPPPLVEPQREGPAWGHERREEAREEREDRRERREDAKAARDDYRDLKRAQGVLTDYDRAARARDRGALSRLEDEALRLIRAEWEEGNRELQEARSDAARSHRELRDDRRDLNREMRQGDRAGAASERRELREDRRDVQEARQQARIEARTLEKLRRMGDQLSGLRNRFRPAEISRKRGIIADFVRMAKQELRWDRREMRDDRRDERRGR